MYTSVESAKKKSQQCAFIEQARQRDEIILSLTRALTYLFIQYVQNVVEVHRRRRMTESENRNRI